ncbi:MAG: NAD(P)-dependent oxidoreductase [Rhodospirillaceae bacterium]|nr:NAD(P)-dependent oxidoreductase [Rhodospirillaceae bacterium]
MTHVLVTGVGGLLGGAIACKLSERGTSVLPTGRQPAAVATGDYRRCELADAADVAGLFADGVDAVVHAAARIRGDDAAAFERDNVRATHNLAAAAQLAGVRRFVLISTISVYSGEGPFAEDACTAATDPYGHTKRLAEQICIELQPQAVVLRLAGLHGAPRRDGVVSALFAQARSGTPLRLAEPDTRVTLTFIDDVVAAIDLLLARPAPSRIYNLATLEAPTYRELAEQIRDLAGSSGEIVSPQDAPRRNRVLNTSRIRRELSFVPLPLERHLARFRAATRSADA